MVVSLDERVIYYFDSYLDMEEIQSRKHTINTLGEVLAQIISSEYYVNAGLPSYQDFMGWQLLDAKGIPNCGQSQNSTVWVLQWMNMEHDFSPVVLGVLLENRTRMMAAMEVVNGSCNELRKIIEDKTEEWWKDIHMARNHSLQLQE